MAQKIYGIDFGTDTIKIYKKGQGIILIEKNVVYTVGKERIPVAIGEEAYEMFEKDSIVEFHGGDNITQQENERISVLHCCSG